MSINSMTNAAIARRSDFAPSGRVPVTLSEIATAASGMPAATPAGGALPSGTSSSNGVNTAMNVLFGYIPKEVLTLYVAVVAAIHPIPVGASTSNASSAVSSVTAIAGTQVTNQDWLAFTLFLIATPLVLWVVYAAKLKSAQKPLPLRYSTWPIWEMFAATVAYVAWAFALSASPFRAFSNWYSPGIASVMVLIASTVLGLLAPLFQQELGN